MYSVFTPSSSLRFWCWAQRHDGRCAVQGSRKPFDKSGRGSAKANRDPLRIRQGVASLRSQWRWRRHCRYNMPDISRCGSRAPERAQFGVSSRTMGKLLLKDQDVLALHMRLFAFLALMSSVL